MSDGDEPQALITWEDIPAPVKAVAEELASSIDRRLERFVPG